MIASSLTGLVLGMSVSEQCEAKGGVSPCAHPQPQGGTDLWVVGAGERKHRAHKPLSQPAYGRQKAVLFEAV